MGCICLIPLNKYSKREKTPKTLDNTGHLSTKIITVNLGPSIHSIRRQIINRMTPSLWVFVLQFLSSDDLIQVEQVNKELKEIVSLNKKNSNVYNENCVFNINNTFNHYKDKKIAIFNISKDAHLTIFNSSLLPLNNKLNNTQSLKRNISSFTNKQNQIGNLPTGNTNGNTNELLSLLMHSSEPSKLSQPNTKTQFKNPKSVLEKDANNYIDTFTKQQIEFSNNSISLNKKKSLSNIDLDLDNKTPSFSENNSSNNQIVNISNINTIHITPIIVKNHKTKVNSYMNKISALKMKDNG